MKPSLLLVFVILILTCGQGCGLNSGDPLPPDVAKIIHAIDEGDEENLKALLQSGAIPTPEGSPLSPIHAALSHFSSGKLGCDAKALKLLLAHGANPNFVDPYSGFSPLEEALSFGAVDCARQLKDAGASISVRGKSGQSLLQFAVKGFVLTGDTSVVREALSWGVDPNVLSNTRSFTALHEAAWPMPGHNTVPLIALLLQSGTDPCRTNSSGDTALDVAQYLHNTVEVQKVLLDASSGCSQNAK